MFGSMPTFRKVIHYTDTASPILGTYGYSSLAAINAFLETAM
jgi:hypothetical protein